VPLLSFQAYVGKTRFLKFAINDSLVYFCLTIFKVIRVPEIQIDALDGFPFSAYTSQPVGKNGPGIILIHGIFGLTSGLRAHCDALAAQGFLAICPDLFSRQRQEGVNVDYREEDSEQAQIFYNNFDVNAGIGDLLSTLAHLRRTPGCGGKLGAIGACLGGRLAFLMAARSDVDCAVGYDNVGIDSFLSELYDVRTPLMLHFGEQDSLMGEDARQKILKRAKRNEVIQTYVYPDAGHSFVKKTSPNYHPENAEQAEKRTRAFLAEWLKV